MERRMGRCVDSFATMAVALSANVCRGDIENAVCHPKAKAEEGQMIVDWQHKTRLVQIAVAETDHGDLEAAVITENLNTAQAWYYLKSSFAAPHRIAIVEVRIPVRQTPIIQGAVKEESR